MLNVRMSVFDVRGKGKDNLRNFLIFVLSETFRR